MKRFITVLYVKDPDHLRCVWLHLENFKKLFNFLDKKWERSSITYLMFHLPVLPEWLGILL